MPVINISDETHKLLGLVARPFVEITEGAVVHRLAVEALAAQKDPRPDVHSSGNGAREVDVDIQLDPLSPVSLTHTRVRSAVFGGYRIQKANWNQLLRVAHVAAFQALGNSFEELRRATAANIRKGKYELDGFSYVGEADMSIQGLDSNLSWSCSLRLAMRIGVPIGVEFEWHNKDAAAHPGQTGRLVWAPK